MAESKPMTPWWTRHWSDVLFALMTLVVCVVVAFAMIGVVSWLGLVSLEQVPCPCTKT